MNILILSIIYVIGFVLALRETLDDIDPDCGSGLAVCLAISTIWPLLLLFGIAMIIKEIFKELKRK